MYKGMKANIAPHGNTNKADNWDWDMPSKGVRKAKKVSKRLLRHRLKMVDLSWNNSYVEDEHNII